MDTDETVPTWAQLFERGAGYGVEVAAVEAALAARRDGTDDSAEGTDS